MTFWPLTNSDFSSDQTFHHFMTFILSLTFTELWVVSMEHLQRVWHASRERLPFRTPGSVPFLGLACVPMLRPDSSNLPCLYSTFYLEYPLVLSRFCFLIPRVRFFISWNVFLDINTYFCIYQNITNTIWDFDIKIEFVISRILFLVFNKY